MQVNYRSTFIASLWHNNPALVQLLGLCPLLAVSTTTINGLALGLATMATVILSNLLVSSTRRWLMWEVRIPIFVLLIAGTVTSIDLVMNAWWHELYLTLGIFIPLIITNCAILARAESFASRNGIPESLVDGIATGLGFALALTLLGSIRELVGQGTLMVDADLLFGPGAASWRFTLPESYDGLLVALLPPGAFIILGLLLAARNLIATETGDLKESNIAVSRVAESNLSGSSNAAEIINHSNHQLTSQRRETPLS